METKLLTVIPIPKGALAPTMFDIIGADVPLKSKQEAAELQTKSVLAHLKHYYK